MIKTLQKLVSKGWLPILFAVVIVLLLVNLFTPEHIRERNYYDLTDAIDNIKYSNGLHKIPKYEEYSCKKKVKNEKYYNLLKGFEMGFGLDKDSVYSTTGRSFGENNLRRLVSYSGDYQKCLDMYDLSIRIHGIGQKMAARNCAMKMREEELERSGVYKNIYISTTCRRTTTGSIKQLHLLGKMLFEFESSEPYRQ